MKEFSDCLPAFELEHFWLNMFNYFHLCARKLNKLNREENETVTISNFLHLFTFHQCNDNILNDNDNILNTISLKIENKASIEAQSEGHGLVDKTSESHLAD